MVSPFRGAYLVHSLFTISTVGYGNLYEHNFNWLTNLICPPQLATANRPFCWKIFPFYLIFPFENPKFYQKKHEISCVLIWKSDFLPKKTPNELHLAFSFIFSIFLQEKFPILVNFPFLLKFSWQFWLKFNKPKTFSSRFIIL